jgi:soluble lytic murein transglycosylase-like protein
MIFVVSPEKRRLRQVLGLVFAAALGLGLEPSEASADIYVYTDQNGVTHFSNVQRAGSKVYVKSQGKSARARSGISAVMPSDRAVDRFSRYDAYIREAATLYQIPVELVRAVIKVESDYDPRAVSHAGAQGLMQLMPETAARMQIRDSFDPRMNILAGTRYLRVLANTFNGDLALTCAGYNAGEGAVVRYGGIPPYEETQNYVMRVLYFYYRYRTNTDSVVASADVPHNR